MNSSSCIQNFPLFQQISVGPRGRDLANTLIVLDGKYEYLRLLRQKMLTGCDQIIFVHINPIFWVGFWVGLFDMLRTRTVITKQVKTNGWRKPKHGGLELEAQKPFV